MKQPVKLRWADDPLPLIRRRLADLKWSTNKLAAECQKHGVSRTFVYGFMAGQRKRPAWADVLLMLDVLGLDAALTTRTR